MSDFRHQWRLALTDEDSPATSTQRLVGLIIVEYANRESRLAWPSAGTIAGRSGLGDRAVRMALHGLVEHGFLVVDREGKGTSTRFKLATNPGTSCRGDSAEPRHLTTPTPARRSVTPARRADKPRKNEEEPRTPEQAHPSGARLSVVCQECGVAAVHGHAEWCSEVAA